jgi:hypothetical protein
VAANPEKSDRAIAAEIGVNKATVSRARIQTGSNAPVELNQTTASIVPAEDKPKKRIGLDGKSRKPPTRNTERQETAQARATKAAALRDSGWDTGQIAAELGVSHRYAGVILEKNRRAGEAGHPVS